MFSSACIDTNCSRMLAVLLILVQICKTHSFIPVHVNYICFSDDSTQLTLKEIQNELKVTASKWYQLGVQLEIPSAMLSTIEIDHPRDVQRCMTEVLDWWLRNAPERSWEKLTEALEAVGGYTVLVEKLRKKTSQG